MGVAVGEIQVVVGADVDEVGVLQLPRAPGPGFPQVADPVEDEDGRALPLEHVDPVFGVHGHGTGHLEGLSVGEAGPIAMVLVNVVTHTNNGGHAKPP